MCGTNMRLGEAMAIAAQAGGRRLPRLTIPSRAAPPGRPDRPGGGNLVGVPTEPARDSPSVGRRHRTGQVTPRPRPSSAMRLGTSPRARATRSARSEIPERDCVVHSRDGTRSPDVQPVRRRPRPSGRAAIDRAGWGPSRRAGRRRLHGPSPPPGLDPRADAVGRELPRAEGPVARPLAQHGLRGGPLPEHRGVLGPADSHDHDPGRHLHPGLRLLRGQDRPADLVRRRRAAAGRRGGRRARSRARRGDQRRP